MLCACISVEWHRNVSNIHNIFVHQLDPHITYAHHTCALTVPNCESFYVVMSVMSLHTHTHIRGIMLLFIIDSC